ncbi:MAG: EAL domain-containing protein [Lachnospiraceae bacterium]|nr:EAL domain-containing protein [Lachnospiraceae bacterium]
MDVMSLSSISYEAAAFFLAIMCGISSLRWKREYVIQKIVLTYLFFDVAASALLDIADVYLTANLFTIPSAYTIRYALKGLFFMTQISIAPMLMAYVMCVTGVAQVASRLQYTVLMLPHTIMLVLAFLNPAINFIYYYDSSMVYHRGTGVQIIYAMVIFYALIGLYFLIRYRKAIETRDVVIIVVSVQAAIMAALLQMLTYDLKIVIFAEALALLSLLLFVEYGRADINVSTGLFTRNAFVAANKRKLYAGQRYVVIHTKCRNMKILRTVLGGQDAEDFRRTISLWFETLDGKAQCYSTRDDAVSVILPIYDEERISQILAEIKNRFEKDWVYKDMDVSVMATISVLRAPDNFNSIETLNELLDTEVPDDGSRVMMVDEERFAMIHREHKVAKIIKKALSQRTLKLYYQPIWDQKEGHLHAAEALARLTDDELGPVPPAEFIPVAEKSGLIVELGEYVMEECCRFISENRDSLKDMEYIEINLSVQQLLTRDLAKRFKVIMEKYNIPANMINLEITETATADESEIFKEALENLKDLGFCFSLDDFGTGYSNLTRIFNMDFTNIKMDKSLLWDAPSNPASKNFLESMISAIHNMGANVIQEGVETREQLSYMKDINVDMVQGYFYSKPLSEEAFLQYVKERSEEEEKEDYE